MEMCKRSTREEGQIRGCRGAFSTESCLVWSVSPEFSGYGTLVLLGILASSFRYNSDVPFSGAIYDRADREVLWGR